jgi:hypothetical protein
MRIIVNLCINICSLYKKWFNICIMYYGRVCIIYFSLMEAIYTILYVFEGKMRIFMCLKFHCILRVYLFCQELYGHNCKKLGNI